MRKQAVRRNCPRPVPILLDPNARGYDGAHASLDLEAILPTRGITVKSP